MHRNSNSRDVGSLVLEGGGRAGRFGRLLGSYFRADRAGIVAFGVILLLCASFVHAQTGIRWDLGAPGSAGAVTAAASGGLPSLLAQPGVALAWCNHPANAVPCTNYATTYTSLTLGVSCPSNTQIVLQGSNSCQAQSDFMGDLGVYTATNTVCTVTCYDYTLTVNGVSYGPYVWTQGGTSSGGGSLPTATAAGQYPNSTGAGTVYTAQSKTFVDVRDVVGAGCTNASDQTTALQAMINNAPDNTIFYFAQGCQPHFSGNPGLTIQGRYGLEFWFEGYTTNACDQPTGAELVYTQTYAPGNVAIYVNRSQRMLFHNVALILGGHADVGFNVDQVGVTPPITTQDYWEGVCVQNNAAPNSSFRGFQFSAVSLNNVDNMHLRNTSVLCSSGAATTATSNGVGYWFSLSSANPKNTTSENPSSTNCSVGIRTGAGSDLTFTNWLDGGNFNGISLDDYNTLVSGYRGELTHALIDITNAVGNHMIMHNDLAQNATGPLIDCSAFGNISGCGSVTLFGNEADSFPSSGDWFNTNQTNLGTLFAFGNRLFNFNPLHWNIGSVVFQVTTPVNNTQLQANPGQNKVENFFTIPNWIQPASGGSQSASNATSPYTKYSSLSGAANVYDDYFVQNLPAGAYGTPTDSTFGIFHNPAQGITSWIALQGKQSGVTYSQIATPAAPLVTAKGTTGATTYTYVLVAYGANGTTAGSAPGTTVVGNASLNTTNYNQLNFPSVAGAVQYDVYRTVGGATQGKINPTPVPAYCGLGVQCVASALIFNDTGLTGDGTTAPVTNTTGQVSGVTASFTGQVSAQSFVASGSNGGISAAEGDCSAVSPAPGAGVDVLCPNSSAHAWQLNNNNGGYFNVAATVKSGTATMTTAAIGSGACGATVTVVATGVATTDAIAWSYNAAPAANPAQLVVSSWPTANNVNFQYCNPSAGSITPAAATLNWRVGR